MTRLEDWMAEEIGLYEREYGPLDGAAEAAFREKLAGTLTGAQLRVADEAGALGDSVLAALRSHSDRLRDYALAEWFRDRR